MRSISVLFVLIAIISLLGMCLQFSSFFLLKYLYYFVYIGSGIVAQDDELDRHCFNLPDGSVICKEKANDPDDECKKSDVETCINFSPFEENPH